MARRIFPSESHLQAMWAEKRREWEPNDVIEIEQELRSVDREKRRVLEQIKTFQQHFQADEAWLKRHTEEADGYQETLRELAVLETYLGELQSQIFALDDLLLELRVQHDF